MSLRKIQVEYLGTALNIPRCERDVTLIVEKDYEHGLDRKFVPKEEVDRRDERIAELELELRWLREEGQRIGDYNDCKLPDPRLRLDYGFGDDWASVELGDGTGYLRFDKVEEMCEIHCKIEANEERKRQLMDAHEELERDIVLGMLNCCCDWREDGGV